MGMTIGKSSHVSVETSATTTEASAPFDVEFVFMMANDGSSDIIVNFDASTTAPGAMTLKPGMPVFDFPRTATTIYYRSVYDTQAFRAWGVK